MLAAVYHGPHDVRLEQLPRPTIADGEALVRVAAASICGTDLRILGGGHRKVPSGTVRVPGHEVVGTVVEIGRDVDATLLGQQVLVAPNMGCGECRACRSGNNNLCRRSEALGITLDGGFAEYVRVPAPAVQQGNLIPIGDADPTVAALIEPLACVLRGQEAVGVGNGDSVLIIGAGPIGLMHTLLARLRGADTVLVSDSHAERRRTAHTLGADRTIDRRGEDLDGVVMEATGGVGVDVVIVAAPTVSAQEAALRLVAERGRINFFAGLGAPATPLALDSNAVHYREIVITGTTGCSTGDCRQAAALVRDGRLDLAPLVSLRLPLARAGEAFEAARQRELLKIVMVP